MTFCGDCGHPAHGADDRPDFDVRCGFTGPGWGEGTPCEHLDWDELVRSVREREAAHDDRFKRIVQRASELLWVTPVGRGTKREEWEAAFRASLRAAREQIDSEVAA